MTNVTLVGNTTQKQVYLWWSPDGFTMVPVSNSNPLPVTGGGGGGGGTSSDFSDPFPSSGTAVGFLDPSGNMAPGNLDADGKLLISGSFSASFSEDTKDDTGSVSSAAVIFTQADTTGFYSCFFQISGIGTSTVVAEVNNNGTWVTTAVQKIAVPGILSSITSDGLYVASTGALGFRLRVSVYDGISTIAADGLFRGFPVSWEPLSTIGITAASLPLPTGAATETTLAAFKSANHTDLGTINTTLGTPFQTGGSIGNTTFASTQSGNWDIRNVTGTISLPTGASTSAKQPALGTAGSASTDVLTIQGISSMTKLLVTPDSVALPANQSVNVNQLAGTTTDTNSGNKSSGTLRVVIATDQPQLTNALKVDGSGVTQPVDGGIASGSSATNPPVTIGGRASTANPTAVADAQVVNTMHDKLGKLIAVGAIRTLKGTQKTSISNTTSETTIVTAVASTFLDLYGLVLANTGATTTKVDIRDTTGGSIITTIEVPTLETRGFMVPVDSAIAQTTVNTNWTAQCASATTAMEVTAFYVKNT